MKFLFSIVLSTSFILPLVAVAAVNSPETGFVNQPETGYVNNPSGSAELQNPLGVNSFQELVKKLLDAAIIIGIPIAVLFIVFAGFKFVLARGNPEALKIARRNLLWTIVGIAIFIGASLIAGVITSTLHQLGATGF